MLELGGPNGGEGALKNETNRMARTYRNFISFSPNPTDCSHVRRVIECDGEILREYRRMSDDG